MTQQPAYDLHDLSPDVLKKSSPAVLAEIARALREELVERVATRGGHLGPNLGVVELTMAIHRSFDSPSDAILWDTGHQAYIHKMVTGRAGDFASLRSRRGLSGYPSRAESPHDWIENSHAGTALAYAAGLRRGFDRTGQTGRHVVAVIGDGALGSGMALEALNDIIDCGLRIVIVLNDNGRSYAPTTGALARHLARLRSGTAEGSWIFEQVGLPYSGPVDGHDIGQLDRVLAGARDREGPVLVHAVTRKGQGYAPAERDEVDHLHGVGPFDPDSGTPRPGATGQIPAGAVLCDSLIRVAGERRDVSVLVAAMGSASGLDRFQAAFPDRFIDVGIAEPYAVTSACGLAMAGGRPIVIIHTTFMNRAVDQVLMDVSLHGMPVLFVCDRAGITGGDGPSHHGIFDLALLRAAPNLRLATPANTAELDALIRASLDHPGPTVIRHSRALDPAGTAAGDINRWDLGFAPGGVAIIAAGDLVGVAGRAADLLRADGVPAAVTNARWISPLDERVDDLAADHLLLVTLEDHVVAGGLGTAVLEALNERSCPVPLMRLGVPNAFLPHGDVAQLREEVGLTPEAVRERIREAWERHVLLPAVPLSGARGDWRP